MQLLQEMFFAVDVMIRLSQFLLLFEYRNHLLQHLKLVKHKPTYRLELRYMRHNHQWNNLLLCLLNKVHLLGSLEVFVGFRKEFRQGHRLHSLKHDVCS